MNRSAPEMTRANTVASLPSLKQQLPVPDQSLPPLIYQCIVWLLAHGLREEGVFRISANSTDMKALKAQFDARREVTLDPMADAHTIAGLLKVYFRELNKPIFRPCSAELYKSTEIESLDRRYEALKAAMAKLSEEDHVIMRNLIMLLREVSKLSDMNCMTPKNLGICWAPTLFGGGAAGTEVVADLIEGYWHIFHDEPLAPMSPPTPLKKKPLPTVPSDPVRVNSSPLRITSAQLSPSSSPKASRMPPVLSPSLTPGKVKRPVSDIVIPPLVPPNQPLPALPKASAELSGRTSSPRPGGSPVSPRRTLLTAAQGTGGSPVSPRPAPLSDSQGTVGSPLSPRPGPHAASDAPPPPPQANKPKRHQKATTDVLH